MKKFTALITMAICLIIGGVYATWNYAKSDLITGSKVLDGVTTITAAVEEGSKGKIEVDVSGFKIEIDDADNDHIGECTVSGQVIVLFTPSAGAHADVKAGGISLVWSLSTTNANWKWETVSIFSVDSTIHELGVFHEKIDATGEEIYPTYKWVIDASEIDACIAFYAEDATGEDGELTLESKTVHEQFKDALHSGSLKITVDEVDA